MNELRLRIIFALIFVFSFVSIISGLHLYPAVRFPQFPNKKTGITISYSETKIYACNVLTEVNLMAVIQPYDKQYFLFSQRALTNEKTSQNMLLFLNSIYQKKYNISDSLCFRVEEKTVSIP